MSDTSFGLIYFPSPRAAAYMQVLASINNLPKQIIIMQSDRLQRSRKIISDHKLANTFFDLNVDIEAFCIANNLSFTKLLTKDINSPEISATLQDSALTHWIFTGGGILQSSLFSLGKQFWHWHPGNLPEVKGSTCFYYSLLHDQQLIVSAFRMNDQIDAGEPAKRSSFRLNIHPDNLTTAFVDVIVDPWIRALCLRECLKNKHFFTSAQVNDSDDLASKTVSNETIIPAVQDRNNAAAVFTDRPCYIIHPLLRWMAIEKINADFDAKKPESIILL